MLMIFIPSHIFLCSATGHVETLTPALRDSIIIETAQLIQSNYVFPDIADSIAKSLMHQRGLRVDIHSVDSLAVLMNTIVLNISQDRHFKIELMHLREDANQNIYNELSESGFKEVKIIDDSIAYIKMDWFPGSDNALALAKEEMSHFSKCRALVFDIRDNLGGSGDMVRLLCSYFFEHETTLYTVIDRTGHTIGTAVTRQPVSKELCNMPIYILTDVETISAGESFAYVLKHHDRATIIGERTAGMAHPSQTFTVRDKINVTIPFLRIEHPKTGTDWENVGIVPDIETSSETALEAVVRYIQNN